MLNKKLGLLFLFPDILLVRTAVGTLGKMFAEAAFVTVFLYTTELYPTVMGLVKYLIQTLFSNLSFFFGSDPKVSHGSNRLSKVAKIYTSLSTRVPKVLPEYIKYIQSHSQGHFPNS